MGLFGIKSKEEKEDEQNAAQLAAIKAEEEGKLTERYNNVMPVVKKYLDSIGFELPPNESIFFMQVDDTTGKWKYGITFNIKYTAVVKNEDYIGKGGSLRPQDKYYYIIQKKNVQSDSSGGVLLTPEGKAYIGGAGKGNFQWRTESGIAVDNSFNPPIHNVLAVGNITNQLLCGVHFTDFCCSDEEDIAYIKVGNDTIQYTDTVKKVDFYFADTFPNSVKHVFVLPSDEETKKNTVTIGSSFTKCSNLELFYCGFDKCVHEKWEMKQHYYAIFEKDTHGTFICPSVNCDILDEKYLVDRTGNFAERNWEFKVGTTISNALPPEEAAKQLKATIAAEEKNLYDKTMPIVKRYLDSIGFELPPDESLLFMQIDENTGKWKYTATVETTYDSVIENEDYVGNGVSSKPGDTNKYIVQSKKVEYACNSGILLTPEGKAYIAQTKQSYWYRFTESGIALDSSICLPFDNVLAVGNITNQLLGGIHFSDLIASHDDGWDLVKDKWFTNSAKKTDVYFLNYISGGLRLKRVFILPSNEQEKKNTVVIGPTFDTSPNLSLFYCGFDKCVHEKSLNYKTYYPIFDKKTHGVFITPSADCDILDEKYLVDRGENIAENNWELRVGTTLQNAVSPKLTAAKEEISKLEATIAAKKAEMASLGMDAQAIVKKARLNMQIKELEPEIEALKAEVEKLGK